MNRPAVIAPAPTCDPAAIGTFCDVVFGYLDGLVPVRFLSEKGTPAKPPHSEFLPVGDLAGRLIAAAQRAADGQRAVYVVPGTVAEAGSARAADIRQTGVVLVDLDDGDIASKRAHLIKHLGPATLEVASGGTTEAGETKLHLYWRLTEAAEGEDCGRVAALRAAIAAKAGGDPSFDSLHQPVRVAGTIHGKGGIQSAVRLLAHSPVEHDLDDLAERVQAMPATPGLPLRIATGHEVDREPNARDLATKIIREGGKDEITRFRALSKVIGHWVRNIRRGYCDREAAWTAVVEHNAAMINKPWDEDKLRQEFDRLLALDVRNHGPMRAVAPVDAEPDPDADDAGPAPPLSDDALAAAFVAVHRQHWRHVADWRAWYCWTGKVWARDQVGQARHQMRLICRRACDGLSPSEARRTASDKTITAALKLVASDPRIAVATDAWDVDRMLLNTGNGVVDLETGEVGPHDPTLMMTQIAGASLGSACPRWLAFLSEITGGDLELQGYLQRLAGYALTGLTTEQVFAFLHGQGANGKSVFLGTISDVLGSYAATATLDAFTATQSPRHLTELAGLRAARLVLVPETESGRAWAEARIKMVTGGERVRANFMHKDHFEFLPQFKLIVAGNHRPSLSHVGEAMRRRMHLVPFTVTVPPEERDQKLAEKLAAERDGILGWMVAGCAEWQRIGLAAPQCVHDAARDYFASEDLLGQWLDESCRIDPVAREQSAALFRSWKAWAEARGFAFGNQKALGEALRARGFIAGKVGRERGWHGLALLRGAPDAEGEA